MDEIKVAVSQGTLPSILNQISAAYSVEQITEVPREQIHETYASGNFDIILVNFRYPAAETEDSRNQLVNARNALQEKIESNIDGRLNEGLRAFMERRNEKHHPSVNCVVVDWKQQNDTAVPHNFFYTIASSKHNSTDTVSNFSAMLTTALDAHTANKIPSLQTSKPMIQSLYSTLKFNTGERNIRK
ncbi:hypothetical protein FACS189425_07660 [Clostridia bacterium]|nr:hypothetical protein FACS189425_07660 [Clostridia bacterium]